MGTDEFGLPCRAVKQNGTYHIVGHLQATPKTVFQKGMDESRQILAAACPAAKIFVAPFARYVAGKCCQDPSHITNYGTEDYEEEFSKVTVLVESVLMTVDGESLLLKLGIFFPMLTLPSLGCALLRARRCGPSEILSTSPRLPMESWGRTSPPTPAVAMPAAPSPDRDLRALSPPTRPAVAEKGLEATILHHYG